MLHGEAEQLAFLRPVMPVAATATARLVRLIILPMTPPAEFDAAIIAGFRCRLFAVTTCRLPNSAFADVSLPVRNTPSQPSSALKNGNSAPVAANARPSVTVCRCSSSDTRGRARRRS